MRAFQLGTIGLLWMIPGLLGTVNADQYPVPDEQAIEVIEARYGALENWIDLTKQLRAKVRHGQLRLASLVPILEGIDDPAAGHAKSLIVVYRHLGKVRMKIVPNVGATNGGVSLSLPDQVKTKSGITPKPIPQHYRLRLYFHQASKPVIDRTVELQKPFDFETKSNLSLTGRLSRNETGKLHFEGQLAHTGGVFQFDSTVVLGHQTHAQQGIASGGIGAVWMQLDALAKGKDQNRDEQDSVKQIMKQYQSSLRDARHQYEQQAKSASDTLLSRLHEVQKLSGSSEPLQIVSAFYGQNVSWLDVTEKVRDAVGKQREWSVQVATKDWGEPAPGFGGPRTLLIAYLSDGELAFKAVYQGSQMSLP